MIIKKYDPTILVLQQTPNPNEVIAWGLQNCFRKDVMIEVGTKLSKKLLHFLIVAEHTSVLEHAIMTLRVEDMSRSLLAQVTRQRTYSFSSSSQHYQDYREYPFIVHEDSVDNTLMQHSLHTSLLSYTDMISKGMPPEEARQALPNAAAVNLQITADARNLLFFFRARLCERNTTEMKIFARRWMKIAREWFPELFSLVGPPCHMDGCCNQGFLQAPICKHFGIPLSDKFSGGD